MIDNKINILEFMKIKLSHEYKKKLFWKKFY
jgi:hypothetical protein